MQSPLSRYVAASLLVAATMGGLGWPSMASAQVTPAAAPTAWSFGTAGAAGWTAERGTITAADGKVSIRPDANRRIVLLSPPSLHADVRDLEEFVLGVGGTGLLRARIQGRRDARGGWITLADARGKALRDTSDGVVIKRTAAGVEAPIERLRIEMEFRTTNPRPLDRIVAGKATP
jgi:hypothetical protein